MVFLQYSTPTPNPKPMPLQTIKILHMLFIWKLKIPAALQHTTQHVAARFRGPQVLYTIPTKQQGTKLVMGPYFRGSAYK